MAMIAWEDDVVQNIGTQWGIGALIGALIGWFGSYVASEETEKGKEIADEWGNGFTWACIVGGGVVGMVVNNLFVG